MKKYIVFILILSLSFFLFGCGKKKEKLSDLDVIKQRGYIIVGVKSDSIPFGFYDKKRRLVGVDIDIAKAIASNIFSSDAPDKYQFVIVDAQNRISKLNSKEVDILVATMSINEKRKLIMEFSTPYFIANQKLMIRKTSKISNLQYFNKYGKLAIVLGTTGEKVARCVVPNANLVGVRTYDEAYKLLTTNKIDAILGDDCILAGFKNDKLKIINRAYSREYYAVAIRKTENSKDLLNTINATIAELSDKRKINLIAKRWIMY